MQKLDDRDAAAETESVPTEGLSKEWAQKIATMPPLSRGLLVGNEPPSGVAAAALVYEACVDAPLSRYRAAQAALAGGDQAAIQSQRDRDVLKKSQHADLLRSTPPRSATASSRAETCSR